MKRATARIRVRILASRHLRSATSAAGLFVAAGALVAASLGAPGCQSSSATAPSPKPTATATATAATPPPPLDCSSADAGWPTFGGDVCNSRAGRSSDPITAQTVSHLAVKWKFVGAGDISATPAVVGGRVYVGDWGGNFYCLDGASGNPVWSRLVADIAGVSSDAGSEAGAAIEAGDGDGSASDGESADSTLVDGDSADGGAADAGLLGSDGSGDAAGLPAANDGGASTQDAAPVARATSGAVIRNTPVVAGGLVIVGIATSPTMVALDQNTGAVVWRTALDTHPNALITSSPVLDNGRIYVGVSSGEEGAPLTMPGYKCCTFRGSVAALDATTGKVLWQTPTIDDATYRNGDGTLSGFSGVAVWSTPTIDRNRKLLYVSTGNNYSVSPAVADAGAPLPQGDHVESIVAFDIDTGAVRWSQRMTTGDVWNFGDFDGPDWDFGSSPNLIQVAMDGGVHDVVGAGQKSGVYWAVDADTHAVLWKTQVGPGGHLGGIQWGTATDGARVYVGVNDETGAGYTLGGAGEQAGMKTSTGSWAALDPASGKTLWQVADPALTAPLNGASVNGPLAVVNGVVFGGSMDADGMMYAFDATSGKVLWSFKSGGSVYGGPAIADGVVYWGCGYPVGRLGFGTTGQALYAFALGP